MGSGENCVIYRVYRKSAGQRRIAAILLASAAAGLGFVQQTRAANNVSVYTGGGTATAPLTGDWNTAGNWSPTGVPVSAATTELDFGGSGSTAYTSTNDIGAGTFTLNEMQFNSSASATEIIAPSVAANTLTFATNGTTTPSIIQNGSGAFLIQNNVIASNLLTFGGSGAGAITLGGSFTGSFADSDTSSPVTLGTSGTTTASLSSASNIASGAILQSAGTLLLNSNASIAGAGTLRFTSTSGSATTPDFQAFTSNTTANDAVTISSTVDLGSVNRYFKLYTGRNDGVRYGGDTVISGTIIGSGGIITTTPGATGYVTAGTLALRGSNSFTGSVTIGDNTSVYTGNVDALHAVNNVNINTTSANVAKGNLFLYGRSVTIGTLTGTTSAIVENGSYFNQSTTAYSPAANAALTVTESANTTYAGKIVDGATDNNSAPASPTYYTFGLNKAGAGTLTLSGSNTYTGPTAITAGILSLGSGGALGATPITVSSGAGFAARVGAGTSTAGGTLSLASGSTFDMLDGAAGKLNLTGSGGTALTLNGNTLGFDLLPSAADSVTVSGSASVAGTNIINIATGNSSLQNGTYNLITAASGLTGTFNFSNNSTTETVNIPGIPTPYTLSLINSDTAEQLVVSGASYAFWNGSLSNQWNTGGSTTNTNWSANAAGTTPTTIPGAATNVVFTVTGGGQNLNTVLGQDFTIGSLTFTADASQPVTIGGSNTLTINTGGITVNASSGAHTISTGALALGATQTWTNNSGNPFTVSAPITGSASNLTFAGTGPFILSGSSSYGGTTINAGSTVQIGNGGAGGSLGAGAVINNGSLSFNRSDSGVVVAGALSGSGTIVQNGSGTSIITGNVTSTGTITVNTGTLQVTNMTVPGVNSAIALNGGTLAVAGTLTLSASTSDDVYPISGGGTLSLVNPASTAAAPDLYANVASSAYNSIQILSNIYVGPGTHYIGGHSGNDSYGEYGTGDLGLEGSLSGPGGLVVSGTAQNSQFEVALYSDDTNWTGPLTIASGDVTLVSGNTNGLTAANSVTFSPATNTSTAALYLFGNNVTIGNLSSTAPGNSYIRNGSLINADEYPPSDAVLTVTQTTNASFAGVISDGPDDYYSGNAGPYNRLGLTMAGTANLTLTGTSTYTGPTSVNSGGLYLSSTGVLGNTSISVNAGATFGAAPGSKAGDPTVSGAGAVLNINGGTFDMTAGGTLTTVGNFNLHQNATFGGQGLILNNATLDLGIAPTGADTIVVDSSASVSGTNIINLSIVGTGTFNAATYALITATSGLTGTFTFSNSSTTETINGTTFTLFNTDSAEEVSINGAVTVPFAAYYTGSISNNLSAGGNGSPTNFSTDANGQNISNYLPGSSSTVYFTANGAQNLSTILGSDLSYAGLYFTSSAPGAVTLDGSNTLTLGAGGIALASGSQGATISTTSLVVGADQTWNNVSGNPLTVSSAVSGGNLTFTGTGPITLTGSNSYGASTINSGALLQVGNGGTSGTLGTGAVADGGTLTFNRSDAALTVPNSISGAGSIVQSGAGTVTLTGTISNTGGITVNGGGLVTSSPLAQGIVVNGGTLTSNGVLTATTAGVTINGGTLVANANVTTNRTSVITINGGGVMQSAGTLNLDVAQNGSLPSTNVTGGGTLQLTSTTNTATTPDIYFGPDHSGAAYYGAILNVSTLDLGSAQRYISSGSGHNSVAKYLSSNEPDAEITSSIIGSGGISYTGNVCSTYTTFYAPLVLAGSDSFTGLLEVDLGSIYLYNSNALNLPAGNPVTLNNSGVGYSHLFLLGNSSTVSNLTSGGTTPAATAVGNGNPTMGISAGPATLTVNETANTTFGGTIADQVSDNLNYGTNVPGSLSLTKVGAATLTLSGTSNYTGATTVSAGNLVYTNSGAALLVQRIGSVSIASGSTVIATSSSNHSNRQFFVTSALSNSGLIDLGSNDLDVQNGEAGFAGGTWNGSTGITSSAAAADSTHLTAVGVLLNGNTYGTGTGSLGTFDRTNPASTDVLVKYTYYGDANLDGAVDGSDYTLIDAGFNSAGALTGWQNGDFNYDGKIDGSDYTLIDNAFNTQGATLGSNPAALIAGSTAQIVGGSSSAVPEPTTLTLLGLTVGRLLSRRRRRSELKDA
jgi:fibronectin-binding autotransporter adhesin